MRARGARAREAKEHAAEPRLQRGKAGRGAFEDIAEEKEAEAPPDSR